MSTVKPHTLPPTFQAQAPICPFCFDDHASDSLCSLHEIKKAVLVDDIEKLFKEVIGGTISLEAFNAIKRKIRYL